MAAAWSHVVGIPAGKLFQDIMIDVVIVNFNAGKLLGRCVAAVIGLPAVARVVVVDNASADGSIEALRRRFGHESKLTVIENRTNVGFSRANNIALEHLDPSSPYVLFLNPDCLVSGSVIDRLQRFMDHHPDAGMAGCLIANPDGSEQRGCRRRFPTPFNSLGALFPFLAALPFIPADSGFNLAGGPLPVHPVEVEAISGSFMFVRRSAINLVGRLDEGYFLHCEDLDWCKRFILGGWKIYFVPEVKVIHYQGACSRRRPLRVSWHKHRGMLRFYGKFYREQYGFWLFLLVAAAVWGRFVMTIPGSIAKGCRHRAKSSPG